METRNSHRKTCNSFNCINHELNNLPPWCSSTSHWIVNTVQREIMTNFTVVDSIISKDKCQLRIIQLTTALLRAEHALKRNRDIMAAMTHTFDLQDQEQIGRLDEQTKLSIGSGTKEWESGRATLWGVPLWKTVPSPYTILATRKLTPGDCWPFSGSRGEIIIEFTKRLRLRSLSLEHLHPDTALSAPRHFSLYVILENGTWIQTLNAEYSNKVMTKRLYTITKSTPARRVVFRIFSNHGNTKYTCVYRIQIYGDFIKDFDT